MSIHSMEDRNSITYVTTLGFSCSPPLNLISTISTTHSGVRDTTNGIVVASFLHCNASSNRVCSILFSTLLEFVRLSQKPLD